MIWRRLCHALFTSKRDIRHAVLSGLKRPKAALSSLKRGGRLAYRARCSIAINLA